MYSTLGSSRLPVICVESRSRRSLALPLLAAPCVAGFAGLLAGAALVVFAGLVAGAGVAAGAEVLTPGSRSAPGAAGCCAIAAAANRNTAGISRLFTINLLVADSPVQSRRARPARPACQAPCCAT